MAITAAAPPPPVGIRERRGWGCWGCGCAALAGVVVLIIALIVLFCFVLYRAAYNSTSTAGVPVQQFDGSDQIYATAHQKIEDFTQQFERGQPSTLRLNANEINTLIARDPSWSAMRGHLFVTMTGSEATVQASFPISQFETAMFADRYVNAEATLGLGFDPDGHNLQLDIHQLSLKGKDTQLQSSSAAAPAINNYVNTQLKQNQLARDLLARTAKISIENGELVIQIQ